MCYNFEPRSRDWYDCDEDGSSGAETPLTWSDILLFPVRLVLVILIIFLISVLPLLLMIGYGLWTIYDGVRAKIRNPKPSDLALVVALILLAAMGAIGLFYKPSSLPPAAVIPPPVTAGAVPAGAPVQTATAAARHLSYDRHTGAGRTARCVAGCTARAATCGTRLPHRGGRLFATAGQGAAHFLLQ